MERSMHGRGGGMYIGISLLVYPDIDMCDLKVICSSDEFGSNCN